MMGFIVSTLAVLFTAWIVYAAGGRAAYLDGIMDANQQWRRELHAVRSDDPCIRYMVARFNADPDVPAGTPNPLQGVPCNCMVPDPCYNGDTCCSSGNYDPAELRAHVAMDDRIYGRNG